MTMVTNRKFSPPAGEPVDLSSKPPGPPPEPGMVWFDKKHGWRRVVVDDPEDRKPLPKPKRWDDRVSEKMGRRRRK